MRSSDQEYFRSCIALERHLAQLLGYHHIEECYESVGTLWDGAQALPAWTRDWAACGPLLVHHHIPIHFPEWPGRAEPDHVDIGASRVRFADHPSRDRALMFGIVKEAIRRLEHPAHNAGSTEKRRLPNASNCSSGTGRLSR